MVRSSAGSHEFSPPVWPVLGGRWFLGVQLRKVKAFSYLKFPEFQPRMAPLDEKRRGVPRPRTAIFFGPWCFSLHPGLPNPGFDSATLPLWPHQRKSHAQHAIGCQDTEGQCANRGGDQHLSIHKIRHGSRFSSLLWGRERAGSATDIPPEGLFAIRIRLNNSRRCSAIQCGYVC